MNQSPTIAPSKELETTRKRFPRLREAAFRIAAAITALIADPQIAAHTPFQVFAKKSEDRQGNFTGISSTNGFVSPNRLGQDNYSMETFIQEVNDYLQTPKSDPVLLEYRRRSVCSVLFLAQAKGVAEPMWRYLQDHKSGNLQLFAHEYRSFEKTIDQREVREWMQIRKV